MVNIFDIIRITLFSVKENMVIFRNMCTEILRYFASRNLLINMSKDDAFIFQKYIFLKVLKKACNL